ncbi:GTP cyclohydrolase FolE2 [Oleidesulfovibrio sp.]|uniref:GTP cyclohydrolase FolE2 n=1 Tax=Oleidesulfovibrio sp. TaxID=2909707 RepID=UPI003A875E37
MEDVQNSPSQVPLSIDTVGVKELRLPIVVSDRANGHQHTVAVVDIGVELPAEFKGTHMSRFVEALAHWDEHLDYRTMKGLLEDVKERLHARKAYVHFRFPYFIAKKAPATGCPGLVSYQCCLTGELADGKPSMLLDVEVPVMTVCPCSKAISDEGAHSQRAMVRISLRMKEFCWLEEFIELAERSASSPVYTLLKREDEKFVTEDAFANPTFVEDVVRNAAHQLEEHPSVSWFRVEVESIESIHNHSAFARIEKHL